MKNIYLKSVLFGALSTLALTSCVKTDDYDVPTIVCNNKFDAANHTLADLVTIAKPKPTQADIIKDNYIVEAYVSSNDESGNIYKMMFLQDKPENPTQGIEIDINGANQYLDFPQGSLVRINLKGLIVQVSNKNIKIGTYDPSYAVGRIEPTRLANNMARVCDGSKAVLATMVPLEFNSIGDALKDNAHINQLIKIKNVQFEEGELAKNFADDAGTGDRYIADKTGGRLDLRFSNYATYAKTPISPKFAGSGDITLILTKYTNASGTGSGTDQAYTRGLDDINFDKPRQAIGIIGGTDIKYLGSFTEDFESYPVDNALFPKYLNYAYKGNRYWQIKSFSSNKYIQMSANAGGTADYHTFFIVPVDFSTAKSFSFRVTTGFYNGDGLKVYTTNNYSPGADISTATLTEITSNFTIPKTPTTGYGTLAPAGSYSFPSTLKGNGFIVFKYEGTSPSVTTTYQIDDIVVKNN
ncbi:DUF5689 domain-containing protein [Soonwooa sp.]|uniref:DUF5689 domain-containing protein n=1 Tax=Soonwooa sp. TaxID=1938592 RepID=UPI002611F8F9|nr:DUF5689 domain-containing protein [Soonwooa sp.]